MFCCLSRAFTSYGRVYSKSLSHEFPAVSSRIGVSFQNRSVSLWSLYIRRICAMFGGRETTNLEDYRSGAHPDFLRFWISPLSQKFLEGAPMADQKNKYQISQFNASSWQNFWTESIWTRHQGKRALLRRCKVSTFPRDFLQNLYLNDL